MEERDTDYGQLLNESRRSFMKKGALASSALALGVSGSGTVGAVQPNQTLVFAYDYRPGQSLDMIARLQQSVTRSILGQTGENDNPIVSDTSEWDTYLMAYQPTGGESSGEYTLVFTRGGDVGDSITLGTSATFFSDEFNLLEVNADGG